MATRSDTRERGTATAERVHHRTNLWHQAALFAGMFLAPFAGLIAAWIIHLWIGGIHLHSGDFSVDQGNHAILWLILTSATLLTATGGIAWLAWEFAAHRKPALRGSLAGSVALVGTVFTANVAMGPGWRISGIFMIAAWMVAVVWSVARLDVARNDKTTDEKQGDSFLEKSGLKDWRQRKVTHETDEHGEPLSTTVEFQHAPGDTVEQLQEAVGAFESVSGSPRGLSQAVGTDRADRSKITVVHKDSLKEPIELPPLPHEGGSIVQPLLIGKYNNGQWGWAYLAGDPTGEGRWSPSAYLQMGMSRTGKTQSAENVPLTDVISRRDVVILYLNKAKGLQDARCIIPGIEAAVIEGDEGSTALYKEAMAQIKRIITYRSGQLAKFAIHEWNAEQCWDNPPWREENGVRVQMEKMPALIVHFGEADAILVDDYGSASYLTSKGLSTGIITGYSLQRADATKMPTGLRFNLGTSWCFGCGDDDSVTMALSAWVVKAGAHPDQWKQRKPGYFYFEGLGIEESLFPVPLRGFGKGENGEKLRDSLLKRNLRNAPRMAKLDRGSANATGTPGDEESWWDRTARLTEELRRSLLTGAFNEPATPDDVADDEEAQVREDIAREVRDTKEVDGVELYPQDGGATPDHATRNFPKVAPQDELSWDDPKPAARDRKAALLAFARSLEQLADRTDLRDPADPTGCTVIVTVDLMTKTYDYRSRPFFSAALRDAAAGTLSREECPTNVIVSRADDLGAGEGKYRLQRPKAGHVQ